MSKAPEDTAAATAANDTGVDSSMAAMSATIWTKLNILLGDPKKNHKIKQNKRRVAEIKAKHQAKKKKAQQDKLSKMSEEEPWYTMLKVQTIQDE